MADERIINLKEYIDIQIHECESRLSDARTNNHQAKINNLEGQIGAYKDVRRRAYEIFPVFDNKE